MALNGLYCADVLLSNYSLTDYYEQHFQKLFYVLVVEPVCRIFLVVSCD